MATVPTLSPDLAPATVQSTASLPPESSTGTHTPASAPQGAAPRKLGLILLTGVVIASMVGGGAFNLPQNMSRGAGLLAVILAWGITFIGMLFLSNSFRLLNQARPELTAGVYAYAREGFGALVGFEIAWGYWLGATFGNVAFAVLVMKTLAYFFPALAYQKMLCLAGGSALIWLMHAVALLGAKRMAMLNVLASAVNLTAIFIVVCIMASAVRWSELQLNLWGDTARLGGLMTQVKSTMLVTLWAFIGIEGAVVVSDRAKDSRQVGRATLIGLGVCTVLYFFLSALPFGVLSQAELAQLPAPSAAYVLEAIVGSWGAVFVIGALLVALCSCWIAWTILVAELPYEGAKTGVFPKFLAKTNRFHAPAPSLWVSTAMMQIALFSVLFVQDAWIFLVSVAGVMLLPPYLSSTAYLWRYALTAQGQKYFGAQRRTALFTGVLGSLYAAWLLYAAGPRFVLLSTLLFALGLPVYIWARKQQTTKQSLLTRLEMGIVAALIGAASLAAFLLMTGKIDFS